MNTFEVGEVAKHVSDPAITDAWDMRYNGMDCEIIGGLDWHTWLWADGSAGGQFFGYECLFEDGVIVFCAPHELRKKRPPESDEAAYRQAMLDCIQKAKQPHRVPA